MGNLKNTLFEIRPHHGLCMLFFKGEGYNQEFVENMQRIVNILEENPDIKLVLGADSLCICCHNRIGKKDCTTQEKVMTYDNAVLDLCELKIGDILSWKKFSVSVKTKILHENLRESVCGDCKWTELCK